MIASRRGLIAVWACAGVLAVTLWLDVRRTPAVLAREIAPTASPETTKAITWDGGRIPIRIERDARSSTGWKWVDPVGDAERQTIEDLLATLRGGRWHRRDSESAAGQTHVKVTIEGSTTLAIHIGQALGEQQWIVIDGNALLVDGWVVRALVPDPVALRIRRPFANVANARAIEMGSFVLQGMPRRLTKLAGLPIELLANAAVVDDLERALGDLTTLAIPRGRVPVDTNFRGTRIALADKLIAVEAGLCPAPNRDLHAIVGPSVGPACVSEAAWNKLLAAAAVFDLRDDAAGRLSSLGKLVEPRPVPVEPMSITLTDGSQLQLAKRPQIAEMTGGKVGPSRDVDPARVAELLAVLAMPGEPVALPATPPVATIVVQGPRSDQPSYTIVLYGNGVIARKAEPIALRVGSGSYDILARAGRAYVDPALWIEEPTTIASVALGDITYTRGAVIGEWTRDKPGAFEAPSVDKLVELLAAPRSLGIAPAATRARTVTLAIKAPIGAARTRTLGIARGASCVATIDGVAHSVDAQVCALVDVLAR